MSFHISFLTQGSPTLQSPLTFILSCKRLCRNWGKAKESVKWNRQAGEKALDLPARSRFGEGRAEPLSDKIRKLQYHKRITLQASKTVAKSFNNTPRSKAFESVCLFHPHDQPIETQSPRGEEIG